MRVGVGFRAGEPEAAVPQPLIQKCQHRVSMERVTISVGGLSLWSEEAWAQPAGTALLVTFRLNHMLIYLLGFAGRGQELLGWEEQKIGMRELAAHRKSRALVIQYPWPEQVIAAKITRRLHIRTLGMWSAGPRALGL